MIVIFWINPFFWLARKELAMIHEFIADKKAAGQDEASLAAMILQAAYPQQFSALVNPFFQSPVKRRIMMLSKNQKVNLPFLRKLLVIPILLVTAFAFTVRTKYTSVPLSKDITVVIDAGHGYKPDGQPDGAEGNNQQEADIVLSIANIVNQINSNPLIRIVMSRTNKNIIDLKSRVAIAQNAHADLFISIHTNASASTSNIGKNNGFEIYVPSKNPPYQKESEIFGSILQRELTAIYPTSPVLLRSKTGIWVVDHNVCPSVLIECGDITNEKDAKFITEESNQKVIAETILNAIALYAKNKESVQQ
jgi:N-acetylmuramoyl-L-alanine amidase